MSTLFLLGSFLAKFAGLLVALLSLLGAGLPFVRAIRPNGLRPRSACLWATAVGLTLYATALALLGFAGFYTPLACGLLLLPGFPLLYLNLSGLRDARAGLSASVRPGLPGAAPTVAIAGTAAILLPAVLAPEIFYDALYYHLGLPSQYLLTGRIAASPDVVHSAFPAAFDLLFGAALALGGVSAAKGLGFLLYLLAVLATAELGREMSEGEGGGAPWFSAAILATVPGVAIMSTLGSVDVGMAFAGAMAWAALAASRKAPPGEAWRTLLLAAFPLGLAAASKYTGLYLVPAVLLPALLFPASGEGARGRIRSLLPAAGAALLIASPWYVRNLLAYGNPVYPFASATLEGGDAAAYALSKIGTDLPRYGISRVADLVSDLFAGKLGAGGETGLLLPAAFLCLAALGIARKRWTPVALGTAVLAILWGSNAPAARYLYTAYPAAAAAAGCTLAWASSRGARAWIAPSVLLLAAAGAGGYRVVLVERGLFSPRGELSALISGESSGEDYLSALLPHTRTARWANENLPKDAVILFVGETRPLYFERRVVFASAYDRPRLARWIAESADGDALAARLRREGITHLFLNAAELARLRKRYGYLDIPEGDSRKVRELMGKVEYLHVDGRFRLAALPGVAPRTAVPRGGIPLDPDRGKE
jgi:hypothetical protein